MKVDQTSTLPPAPWVPPNSRDWVRDHLANAGVMVQRQFRSDQERIAELEAELAEALKERDRWREAASSVDLVTHGNALTRLAELEALVENLEAREQELYSRGRRIERERDEARDAAKSLAAIVERFMRDAVTDQDGAKP